MTSCSLGFSMINENNKYENFQNKNTIQEKRVKKNKTIKASKKPMNEKVKSMIEILHTNENEGDNLNDFDPPPNPVSMANEKKSENDKSLTHENFAQLTNGSYAKQYYNQFIPQTKQLQESSISSQPNELLEKLNYMIHLLEESHDEKSNNITEEIVLYTFLGVFVIFIVDSFVKVGKYIR